MYHVIGTGLTTTLLYLISYLFYNFGYYSLQFHRKLWNYILAATFIITAVAGLFLALQITYKWDIPFVKSLLKYHVETGIGLAFTGVFHFFWHLSYFTGKKDRKTDHSDRPDQQDKSELSSTEIGINLFTVGFVSTSFQLLLIREMMNISGGYELITGTFLASWLIASAIGSALAGRSNLRDVRKINLIFVTSPVITLLLLFSMSRLFLTSGETPSFLISVIYTFIILIPFCLVSGFTFIKLMSVARSANGFFPGKSFAIETAGGVTAGALIVVFTSGLLNTYQLVLMILALSVTYVLLTFYIKNRLLKIFTKILVSFTVAAIIIFNPDIFFRQLLLPGIKVNGSKDTPYGNITTGTYKGEQSIYYNQRLLSFNDDVIEREENIHYAMLQSESPSKVLLVSGSLKSLLPEILKYPVDKVVYIERDPALASQETVADETLKERLTISNDDAFRYIRVSKQKFDVIMVLVPPPSTLLLNRYYTTEFFSAVKNRLSPQGVFMCSPGPGDTYFNKESLDLYSSVYSSLKAVFRNVVPVVGYKLYYIASDKEISVSFCQLTELRHINNIYVSSDYISDDLIIMKSNEVKSLLDKGKRQNRSAIPVASFYYQSFNFSKNLNEKTPAIILLLILFALPLFKIKRSYMLMYFSASALAGFEILSLITIQLIIGNMYQLTGIIIGGLMLGLAVGAATDFKLAGSVSLRIKGLFLLVCYLAIGLAYNYLLDIKNELPATLIIIGLTFLPAFITGNIFRELTFRMEGETNVSGIYGADLAGSASGFILVSAVAIPLIGIQNSIFLLSTLILAGILLGTVRNKY